MTDKYKIISYTTDGNEYYGGYYDDRHKSIGNSLHIAVSCDYGKTYKALNHNIGILFVKADYSDNSIDPIAGDETNFESPVLFKMDDGRFGVIAEKLYTRNNQSASDGKLELYTSEDLVKFSFAGYIEKTDSCIPHNTDTDSVTADIQNLIKITSVLSISEKEYNKLCETYDCDPVCKKAFPSDFIPDRADPCILLFNDKYYFVATKDDGRQDTIYIRSAFSINELAEAEDVILYKGETVWAPELHNVNGRLMIFFANGSNWDKVQSHVMVMDKNSIPDSPECWSEPVRIKKKDNINYLMENGITLDMTCFEWQGKYYLAWAQRETYTGLPYTHGSSDICIAEYNPDNPYALNGDVYVISKPEYGWERSMTPVAEGPYTLENSGRLYMTVAVNATNVSYGIKLLTLKEGGNPLLAEDWETKGYPVLCTAMNKAEPGPGHSSFLRDKNGDVYLVYHWGKGGTHRNTTLKKIAFSPDGEPILF